MAAMVEPLPRSLGPVGQPGRNNAARGAGKTQSAPNTVTTPPTLNARRPSAVERPGEIIVPGKNPKIRNKSLINPTGGLSLIMAPNGASGTTKTNVSMGSTTSSTRPPEGKIRRTVAPQKKSKDEISKYHSEVKTVKAFDNSTIVNDYYTSILSSLERADSLGSIPDLSTLNNREIITMIKQGTGYFDTTPAPPKNYRWAPRWCLDKSGRHPGQIKGIKDMCVLRASGNIAVTESKNNRIQIFKKNTGISALTLGDTATSIHDPNRKIEPTGLCEVRNQDNVLLVTDKNRILVVDTNSRGKIIAEVKIKDKTDLQGIAMTQSNHLFVCEVGMQPSVGVYEETGKLVRELPGRDFRTPCYVSWNEEYEVCAIADSEQHCVLLYDAKGRYLNRFGSQTAGLPGDSDANLIYPSGLCWMPEGRLLVADRSLNKVVLFDLRNKKASVVLSKEAHSIQNPVALTSNARNRIVVSEEFLDFGSNKSRIKMFHLDEVKS